MLDKIRSIDPRWLFLLFFSGVFFDTFYFSTNMKTFWQLVMGVTGALGSDILFNYLRHRKWIFPQSGLVTSCGTFVLISSPVTWPFFLLGFLSIYSKHFVTYNGRHIFNPVNFGAVLVLFYCNDCVQNGASTWSGNYFMIPYLVSVGVLLTILARRIVVSLAYLSLFVLFDKLYLHQFSPANITALASPPFMLFIFFMISDPKTTPKEWWRQILFAFGVVLIEGYCKINKIPNSLLWGLFVVSFVNNALIPMAKDLADRLMKPVAVGA